MFPIPCVIFAGGRSSRMGQDKSLLPFRGFSTLTAYQFHRLKPLFKSTHISSKEDKFGGEFPLILDESEGVFSPMVGLATVLEKFPNSYVFCISVDAPFVEKEQIKKLWNEALKSGAKAVIPQDPTTKHPLCGIYHSSLSKMARELKDENRHRISLIFQKCETAFVEFEDEAPFTNLNYFDEYEKHSKSEQKGFHD